MKRKAGIFDPWRQKTPPPVEEPRRTPTDVPQAEANVARHCVQFSGQRAGIHVWVEETPNEEDYSDIARRRLVGAVQKLMTGEAAEILASWGVFNGTAKCANPVTLVGDNGSITISSPDDGDSLVSRAVDTLSLALREAVQKSKSLADFLTGHGIKPYVK